VVSVCVGRFALPVLAAVAGFAAAVLVGGWLVQQAFASGPPEVVIACLTVVDPIVAVLLGAVLLGEGVATPAETWFLLAGAAITATAGVIALARDRKSTRLNSSHVKISYAVFCLKKKTII